MSEKPEGVLLDALAIAVGFLVESTEIDIQDAIAFAQISSHTQGFGQGVLLTWPSSTELARAPSEVAKLIAGRLEVPVLLESDANASGWLLAKPDGSTTITNVIYLDDGIDIAPH